LERIQLKIVGLSSSQSQIGSYALVLGEVEGNRRLPIIIGSFEAQAIALEIENIRPNRPMTHDLVLTIARSFQIELKEVVISDLKEGVFFSRLVFEREGEVHEIDARPSDAIAIAVRYRAPIYTYEFILDQAGIVLREPESKTEVKEEPTPGRSVDKDPDASPANLKARRLKELTVLMNNAIQNEDFEEAARIRDQIKQLEEN
jgi:bifunctional DNase/RNase